MLFTRSKTSMPSAEEALPSRPTRPYDVGAQHAVLGNPIEPPFPEGLELALFGMGCFWGAERKFWQTAGVYSTAVGYAGGFTPNPTYEEVCSGRTGHTEVVLVVFDPARSPTRSCSRSSGRATTRPRACARATTSAPSTARRSTTTATAQQAAAEASRGAYQKALDAAGYGAITTEIGRRPTFYYAEDYHQQYLHKNPGGYCGIGGTGVSCPIGLPAKRWIAAPVGIGEARATARA